MVLSPGRKLLRILDSFPFLGFFGHRSKVAPITEEIPEKDPVSKGNRKDDRELEDE